MDIYMNGKVVESDGDTLFVPDMTLTLTTKPKPGYTIYRNYPGYFYEANLTKISILLKVDK